MCYLGIDIGGTKIAAGIVDVKGKVIGFDRILINGDQQTSNILERISNLIDIVVKKASFQIDQIDGIGIGLPGAVDRENGKIHFLTNLSGWAGFPIKKYFQDYYNAPTFINNDANAAALGEYFFGDYKGIKDMLYITVSTGIGAGIISNGQLINGANGVAGEIGHMILEPNGKECSCGKKGCWETISSGTAIAKEMFNEINMGRKSILSENIKAEDVFAARELGDQLAIEITDKALDYLGIGIANLVNAINPKKIIIGGGVSKVGSLLFERVNKKVSELAFGPAKTVKILPSTLGDKEGVIGAATIAITEFLK